MEVYSSTRDVKQYTGGAATYPARFCLVQVFRSRILNVVQYIAVHILYFPPSRARAETWRYFFLRSEKNIMVYKTGICFQGPF